MSTPIITSSQNQHVKDAAKLRVRREREKQGRFLIDGARELMRAIMAGVELVEAFVCESLCGSPDAQTALHGLRQTRARVLPVTPKIFEKLVFGQRAEGVLGIAKIPSCSLENLRLPDRPCVAVVESLEKPGNLGAILRSADATGLAAVIATGSGTDLYNPNVIRASLGTLFTVPTCAASAQQTLEFLLQRRMPIYAARVDAATLYTAAPLAGPAAIVLGSEAAGVSSAWRGSEVTPIKLPMLGVADSLNVSAAAAVLFYEAVRQRAEGRIED